MDPFDELARSIIVSYQSPNITGAFSGMPSHWGSSTDAQRRSMVRNCLYESPKQAEEWVNHLVVVAEGKRREKEAKAAAATKVEAKPAAALAIQAPPAVPEASSKPAAAETPDPQSDAKAAEVIAKDSEWLAGLPDFFNQLGRDGAAQKKKNAAEKTPAAEKINLPDWVPDSPGTIALQCATYPEKAAKLAGALKVAVPFSIVWMRELDEIAESRKTRHRIDPQVWLDELLRLKSTLEDERKTLDECTKRAQESPTGSEPTKAAADYQRINNGRAQVDKALRIAGLLREKWDSLRVDEQELIEQLASAPERQQARAEDRECKQKADVLRKQREKQEKTAGNLRSRFYKAHPKLRQVPCDPIPPPGTTPRLSPLRQAEEMQLIGLAFSGGGIRSATFNLGVLQALAELGILKFVDYLSTVSGGGYIGSWFTAWCSRSPGGVRALEPILSPHDHTDPSAPKLAPLTWLREFSNYLAPATGFLSADTWTIVATWLRNTILNQLVLVSLLAGLLSLPYALVHVVASNLGPSALAVVAAALLAAAVRVIAINLRTMMPERKFRDDPTADQLGILCLVIAPLSVSAFLFITAVWEYVRPTGGNVSATAAGGFAFAGMGLVSFGLALTYRHSYYRPIRKAHWRSGTNLRAVAGSALCGLIASLVAASLVYVLAGFMKTYNHSRGVWAVVAFGAPAGIAIFSAAIVVQIGLMGNRLPDDRREWWSRAGAWLMLSSLGWAALAGIGIYGPLWVALAGAKLKAAGGLTWAATTIGGLLAGKSADTDGTGKKSLTARMKEVLAMAAPYVFVAGLLVLISYGLFRGLVREEPPTPQGQIWTSAGFDIASYWAGMEWIVGHPLCAFTPLALLTVACLLAWRVDVNEFSMHHFYKNRLVRCYLGASRRHRRPNLFTGFDDDDDIKLCSLQLDLNIARSEEPKPNAPDKERPADPAASKTNDPAAADPRKSHERSFIPYSGPYPIVNTALNTAQGERLAWQERKAESFIFTPCYSGFACDEEIDPRDTNNRLAPHAYRPTESFGYAEDQGPALGTAVAISGAAVSPNMGYHTSPAVSFLLTMFNVRLGWWFGNPRHREKHLLSSPRIGLLYLVTELTGSANNRTDFVSLSDGGHFENLGVYELIRRRCRCIIVGDAEEDSSLKFGGLGGVIRKCRIDFNIEIEIVLDRIVRIPGGDRSVAHCAIAEIRYPADVDHPSPFTGKLIYLKSSVTGDEPSDIREYNWRAEEFPHQSTADQFFDESQFESYRSLGHHIAISALSRASKGKDFRCKDHLRHFLDEITSEWLPPTEAMQKSFLHSTSYYADALTAVGKSTDLKNLGHDLFGKPKSATSDSEHLYLLGIIQAMENIFLDLELEKSSEHPLNTGWMEVFKQWSDSEKLRIVWKANQKKFSSRFGIFCNRTLRMDR